MANIESERNMKNIYDYQVKKADGTLLAMNDYSGWSTQKNSH